MSVTHDLTPSVPLPDYLCIYLCITISASLPRYLSLPHYFCLTTSVSISASLSLPVALSPPHYLGIYLYLTTCICLCLSIAQFANVYLQGLQETNGSKPRAVQQQQHCAGHTRASAAFRRRRARAWLRCMLRLLSACCCSSLATVHAVPPECMLLLDCVLSLAVMHAAPSASAAC